MPETPPLLRVVRLPFATVVLPPAALTAAPRWRLFAGLATAGAGGPVLGQAVLEEFGTLSAPICLVPRALAGKVYDRGLAASYTRDQEMGIDAGWPPLVLGVDLPTPELPGDWVEQLDRAFAGAEASLPSRLPVQARSVRCGAFTITAVRLGTCGAVATDAPLLPRQLRRLGAAVAAGWSAAEGAGMVVALGTASGLATRDDGGEQTVGFLGEAALSRLVADANAGGSGRWA